MLFANFSIILIINLIIIILSEDNTSDILVLKFKEYYHLTYNMLQNNTKYNSKDFIDSFLLSQIYLELVTENETNQNKIQY